MRDPASWLAAFRRPTSHRAPGPTRFSSLPILRPVVAMLAWGERSALRKITLSSVSLALVFACTLAVVGARQWWHVRGWPVEHARIVAAVPTGDTEHCGRSSSPDVYRLTWVSQDPPAGLPAEFTNVEGCGAGSVGDEAEIVRVVGDDGSVHVWDGPATSVTEVLLFAVAGLFLVLGIGCVVGLGRLAWELTRRRWRPPAG